MYVDKEILLRYIKGELSSTEVEEVLFWIEKSDENFKVYAKLKSEYLVENMPDTLLPEGDVSERLRRYTSERKLSFLHILTRVAALLLIPISVLSGIYLYRQSKEISTYKVKFEALKSVPPQEEAMLQYVVNRGVKGFVVLPDGSEVWLNSASTLKCPAKFSSECREVELDGEGFFQVKGNDQWPMFVKTSKGITAKVLGTTFNISSYSDDADMRFTLISGNVVLIKESAHQTINVKPNDEVIIPDAPKERGKIRQNVDVQKNTKWKDGILFFENTPMGEVVKRMERWYGTSFTIKDRSIYDYRFTGAFDRESLIQVLEILKISSNISYTVKEREVALYL